MLRFRTCPLFGPLVRGKGISKLRRGLHKLGDSGASAIEFAIVMPLFLVVAFGILAYGMYFGAAHSAQQLAADAARASIAGLTTDERSRLAMSYVSTNAEQYGLLRADKVKTVAAVSSKDANDFLVTVSYDASDLPIWGLSAFVPLPSKTINRVSVIRRGGY